MIDNSMRKKAFMLLVLIFASAFGCVPLWEKKVRVSPPRPGLERESVLPKDHLDRKIRLLKMRLDGELLTEEERKIALSLLETYSMLKDVPHPASDAEYRRIINTLVRDLDRLEEAFFPGKDGRRHCRQEAMALFSRKREKIRDAFLSGDHKGALRHCLELQDTLGADALTPEVGLVFALCLAEEGMEEEALAVGERIVGDLETGPDLTDLAIRMAELHLRLGRREKALRLYERITDRLDEREARARFLEARISGTSDERTVLTDIDEEKPDEKPGEADALTPFDRLLREVDRLVGMHEYDRARLILLRHRLGMEEGEDTEIIDQALRSIDAAQERFRDQKVSKEVREKEALRTARKLIEDEDFEEAITRLEELEQSIEFGTESRVLRAQAIEKLVARERNRAAKLFLSAKGAADPENKEKYLTLSRDILKLLIEKYPSSSLNQKLKSNLLTVEKELAKLGRETR
jgi:tetratricopeptide (TPR) repeat protein